MPEKDYNAEKRGLSPIMLGMANGPDGMQAHIAFMEQRVAGMKMILKARTALYQVLTPEQKTVFDQFGPQHHRHG